MAKLVISSSDVTNKYISFISLDKNNTIFDNGIFIANYLLKFNGNNPTNLAINSKNNLNDNSKSTNVFEFSNNDYVDLDNVDIVKKNVDDSNNIISILSKGINVKSNSDSIVSINSIDNNIENSETITTINTKHSKIDSSKDIFTFGTNLDIQKSNSAIIIGNNISTYNTNENVMIGFNINTNNSNQILIGNFDGVNTKSMEVGISQGKNYLYKSGDIFHVSKNLILDENLRNDKSNSNIGRNCVILGNDIVTYEDNSNENDIILSNNAKITNTKKSIILGESLKIKDNTSSIFGGLNNETIESTSTLVFGDSNKTSYILNDYIIGNNNNNESIINSIIYGASNRNTSIQNSFIGGIYNDITATTNNLIAGQLHNISNPYGSFIIGEQFHSVKIKGEYKESYIISNQNTSICFNSDYISIGNNEPITYMKFVEDSKGFAEYYSEFKYSLVSSFRYTPLNDYNQYFRFVMGKGGFCTICGYFTIYDNSPVFLNLFEHNGKIVYNFNYDGLEHFKDHNNTLLNYISIRYDKNDDNYDICVCLTTSWAEVYPIKSSKCTKSDKTSFVYDNTAEYFGGYVYNLVSRNDCVYTYYLNIDNFTETGKNVGTLYANTLYTSDKCKIDVPNFIKIRNDVPKYNYYVYTLSMGTNIFNEFKNSVSAYYRNTPLSYVWYNVYFRGQSTEAGYERLYFHGTFYNKEVPPFDLYVLNVGGSYDPEHKTNESFKIINETKFKKNDKLYRYFDLQRNAFLSTKYIIEQTGQTYKYNQLSLGGNTIADNVKSYTNSGSRRHSPDKKNPNSNFLDNGYYVNDMIVKFCHDNSETIHYIINHDLNGIMKWGIYANATLSSMTCVSDSFKQNFAPYGYKYMEIFSRLDDDMNYDLYCRVPGDTPDIKMDIHTDADEYFGNNKTISYKQTIFKNDMDKPYEKYFNPVYIPFLFYAIDVSNSSLQQLDYGVHQENSKYLDMLNGNRIYKHSLRESFEPKNSKFEFITTIHNFTQPLNLYIRYNNNQIYYYRKSDFFNHMAEIPLFFAKLSFNENTKAGAATFKDYNGGFRYSAPTYMEEGGKYNAIKGMIAKDFRYLNIMNPTISANKIYKFRPIIGNNVPKRLNFTYMLKYLTTPIT